MKKAKRKQGFIMYKSWTPIILSLSNKEAGQLIKAVCRYQEGETPEIDGKIEGIFLMMKEAFKADNKKYNKTCEARKIAGRLGGLATQQKARDCAAFFAGYADGIVISQEDSENGSKQ